MEDLELLKYPVGRFKVPGSYTKDQLNGYITILEMFPEKLFSTVEKLNSEQLNTPYRPGGWTVIQVVNHCADSHMNAIIRVKAALTEDRPTIKPYLQDLWANLADGSMPIQSSISILRGVHSRWTTVLKSLNEEQWLRGFIHPEKGKELSLKEATASYSWHCEHHLAHVVNLIKRMGWKQ
ncbi:MAG: putative metal-dependent hydrolase [Bacteroidia bacterium]|nr:putative metal-dependent hydrolase [Bacteroidia bacterium]